MTQPKPSNRTPSDCDLNQALHALRRDTYPTPTQQRDARARLLRDAAQQQMLPPLDEFVALVRVWLTMLFAVPPHDRYARRIPVYLLYSVPHHYNLDHFLSQRLIASRA